MESSLSHKGGTHLPPCPGFGCLLFKFLFSCCNAEGSPPPSPFPSPLRSLPLQALLPGGLLTPSVEEWEPRPVPYLRAQTAGRGNAGASPTPTLPAEHSVSKPACAETTGKLLSLPPGTAQPRATWKLRWEDLPQRQELAGLPLTARGVSHCEAVPNLMGTGQHPQRMAPRCPALLGPLERPPRAEQGLAEQWESMPGGP